jgi:arsenite methyltransferase
MENKEPSDHWSHWLLHHRHGDDEEYGRVVQAVIERYADRVLDGAQLAPGMTLADIGTGDGLIAFRAIDRIGPTLQVILTDISEPLLQHTEGLAREREVARQCTFVNCSAEKLTIANGSVDAVTTRSVLAYVADKRAALGEFHRVLKPGGRISIAEPVLQDEALQASALRTLIHAQPQSSDHFLPLLHRWKAAQFPDTDELIASSPIANYSERDLLRFAHAAGFTDIHLELHIDISPSLITSWELFLNTSPHPWAPPLRIILEQQFSEQERQIFEKAMRPTVEAGDGVTIDRMVYLTARKKTG